MKIGIITLSASNNCGSLLQTYALKKLLEAYGKVDVINFASEASHAMYDVIPKRLYRHPRSLLKRIKKLPILLCERNGYKTFRDTQLGITGRELYYHDLADIAEKYDVVVAGSDQVWNVMMGDFDKAFFCDWTSVKKVAYAPSLGGHDIRESADYDEYIGKIKEFAYLSAREEFGKHCLEEISGRTVERVLDPTLTVDPMIWKKLIGEPIVKGDYVFFYSWAYNDKTLLKIVFEQRRKTNMPVYVVDGRKWISKSPEPFGFTLSKKQGPLAFLNLMYYAKRCYVESFHGMIFAYLFQKDFWLLDWHENLNDIDRRLRELVDLLDMEDRIITPYNCDNTDQTATITYSKNCKLDELRRNSRFFIEASMS